jgi:hypothetical protein
VEDEGPKRGFSLRGWNENLPKNFRVQLSPKSLGQSLINIATRNITIFSTTNSEIMHELLLLLGLASKYGTAAGLGESCIGWITLLPLPQSMEPFLSISIGPDPMVDNIRPKPQNLHTMKQILQYPTGFLNKITMPK